MDLNDFMTMKALSGGSDHSSYETYMIAEKQSRRPSTVAVTGLALGSIGLIAGIGAWVFGGVYANAKGNQAKEAANTAFALANANHTNTLALIQQQQTNTNATIDRLINAIHREADQRIACDVTLTNTVTDSVSGSQQGTLTAQQAAELAASQATQQVMQQTFTDAVTGRSSLNPTPVTIYSAPSPCGCPNGCGQ